MNAKGAPAWWSGCSSRHQQVNTTSRITNSTQADTGTGHAIIGGALHHCHHPQDSSMEGRQWPQLCQEASQHCCHWQR